MADFVHPLTGLTQGLQGGLNLGLQMDQVRRARKQQEWENDFRMMGSSLNLAQALGLKTASGAKVMNESFKPVWDKRNPNNPFPDVTPENVQAVEPLVKSLYSMGEKASKGKIPWDAAFLSGSNEVAAFWANSKAEGEERKRQEMSIEAAMAPIKGGFETAQAQAKKRDAKTPDEILKEMFDINTKVVGMQKMDQNTALLLGLNPEAAKGMIGAQLTPEQLAQVKGVAAARMQALNDLLPEGQKLEALTEQEYQEMLAAGHPPEEIFRKAFIVQQPGK